MKRSGPKIEVALKVEGLWLAGKTIHEAAACLRTHPSYVRDVVHKYNLPYRGRDTKHRQNMWPLVVAWAKAGYTEEEIKAGLGYNLRTP
jgi:hypothetical protein